jgi:hypothetical protein
MQNVNFKLQIEKCKGEREGDSNDGVSRIRDSGLEN